MSPSRIPVDGQEPSSYKWVKSTDGSSSMSRQLTHLERMFAIFNKQLHGQNVGFTGATISLQRSDDLPQSKSFDLTQLRTRTVDAFCQTRWKYPTVAARLLDGDKALYVIESEGDVKKWAERTVSVVLQDGGWLNLREHLSRASSLPTMDSDYFLLYVIVHPDQVDLPELRFFDILMHTHHSFHDGTGLRVILNEFLERLADPLGHDEIAWGQEVERLLPASILLEKEEESEITNGVSANGKAINGEATNGKVMNEEIRNGTASIEESVIRTAANEKASVTTSTLPVAKSGPKGLFEPDVGLPVYRPDILTIKPENRGTLLECHTFDEPNFLPELLAAGRKRGVKLSPLLHAALLKAVYDSSDIKPSAEDVYNSAAPMDLRNGYLLPEYCERTKYVNNAVAIQPINVPCYLFSPEERTNDGFWKAAACIGQQWSLIIQKKGFGKKADSEAKARIESMANLRKSLDPSKMPKPRTCPSFVSDPPGSHGLRGTYPVSGHGNLSFVLESYQAAADQMQAVVSARSHSWNGLLTLCVSFNAVRNPRDKMQAFVRNWSGTLENIRSGSL